jgi:hypothetical protein
MWKVQRTDDSALIVLLVSGRIEGEHLAELREVFTAEAGNQSFILDMGEVWWTRTLLLSCRIMNRAAPNSGTVQPISASGSRGRGGSSCLPEVDGNAGGNAQ